MLRRKEFVLATEIPLRPEKPRKNVVEPRQKPCSGGKRSGTESEAGQVRYWQCGQAEKSPDLAISDLSRFLPRSVMGGVSRRLSDLEEREEARQGLERVQAIATAAKLLSGNT